MTHWSGPGFVVTDDHIDHLVEVSAEPGAFSASISHHRVGSGGLDRVVAEPVPQPAERIAVPTTVLWPDHDPLFPTAGPTGWVFGVTQGADGWGVLRRWGEPEGVVPAAKRIPQVPHSANR